MPGKTIHGASITSDPLLRSTYNAWNSMKQRCLCPTHRFYKDYGGRGITVCERWLSFENFLADMKVKPAGTWLERRDNNKGYEPGNCYWATPLEQGANKRNNRLLEIGGRSQHIAAWEREAGLPVNTIYDRLRHGWPVDAQLLKPLTPRTKTVCIYGHPKEPGKRCKQCVSRRNHEQHLKRKPRAAVSQCCGKGPYAD